MNNRKKIAGAVVVPKDIFDHPFLNAESHCRKGVFIDLQTLANDAPRTTLIRGIPVPLKAGQLAWSQESLARRYGWSTEKFKRFLIDAQDARLLRYETTKLTTIITIQDYDVYNTEPGTNSGTESVSEPGTNSGQNWEAGMGSRKKEVGSAPPEILSDEHGQVVGKNFPTIEGAVSYFARMESDYAQEEIEAAWHSLNSTVRDGQWFNFRGQPIGDWRSALETELATRRNLFSKNTPRNAEFHKKPAHASNVLSLDEMRRATA